MMQLDDIFRYLNSSGIPGHIKELLQSKGQEAAEAVVKHVFAEHAPIDITGDEENTQNRWAQTCFENFKHFLRVGGHDYGMPDFPGIQTGADIVYMDGEARTAIHELCNSAVAAELAKLKVAG